MSNSLINPLFDLQARNQLDESIQASGYFKVYEAANVGSANTDEVKRLMFRIDNMNDWIALSRSFVVLPLKIVKDTDGAPYANNAYGKCFINGMNLMRSARLLANGSTIDSYADHHHIVTGLEQQFEYDSEYANSYGSAEYYTPDDQYKFVNQNLADPFDAANKPQASRNLLIEENKSFFIRQWQQKPSDGGVSNVFYVRIPLSRIFPGLIKHADKCFKSIQWEMHMELAPDSVILENQDVSGYASAGADSAIDPRSKWGGIPYLQVHRVVPNDTIHAQLLTELNSGFKLSGYMYEDKIIYRKPYLGSEQSDNFRLGSQMSRPTKIYVIFQRQNKENAGAAAPVDPRTKNSLQWDQCNINEVSVFVNGILLPSQERYVVSFGDAQGERSDRLRAYEDLCASKGLNLKPTTDRLNRGIQYSFDQWQENPVYCFNVTDNVSEGFNGASEISVVFKRSGEVDNPDNSFYCYALVCHEKYVDIEMSNTKGSITLV